MMKRLVRWSLVALLVAAAGVAVWWMKGLSTRQDAALTARLHVMLGGPSPAWLAGDAAYRKRVWAAVRRAYRDHHHHPLWVTSGGPTAMAHDFVVALDRAPLEGIDPEAYGLAGIRAAIDSAHGSAIAVSDSEAERLASLDVHLTAAFLSYARERHDGRLPPQRLDPVWRAARDTVNANALLAEALASRSVTSALAATMRTDSISARLRRALQEYRLLVARGGWPAFPKGPAPHRGDDDRRVLALRRRLACTGDLADSAGGSVFDDRLERGLRHFQKRHGLPPDGRLDDATRAALAVPAAERLRTIEINLERARWLPAALPEPHLLVNIPEYRLRLVDGAVDSLAMRVVVGKASSQTPVFSAEVSFLEFNPTWRLPKHILVEEILPEFHRDPEYFHEHQMRAMWTAAREPVEVEARQVDWTAVEEDTFHVLVVQDAGPENPLGRIKFMCPNPYDVYLHDTPARGFFSSRLRDLSHGCVRVEDPLALAERLLRGTPIASRDSIEAIIAGGAWRRVVLAQRMPVHVQYWTSWVDSSGAVQFRPDVYGLDHRLDVALRTGRVSDFVINQEVLWGAKLRASENGSERP